MRHLIVLLFVFVLSFINNYGQFQVSYAMNGAQIQYILPNEAWRDDYHINASKKIIMVDMLTDFRQLSSMSSTPLLFDYNDRDDYDFRELYPGSGPNDVLIHLVWMSNHTATANNSLYLFSVKSVALNIPVGDTVQTGSFGWAYSIDLENATFSSDKQLVGINGICGDANRDGVVNHADIDLMWEYFEFHMWSYDHYGKYTKTGVNFGLGRVLFPYPDELSLELIHLWIHNPNDPRVAFLHIGEEYNPANFPPATSVVFEIENNIINITTDGNVVNVSGLVDEQPWQKTVTINGNKDLELPAGIENITVDAITAPIEAVTAIEESKETIANPTNFTLNQNYPNPFNPTTTISYSISEPSFVSLKVYDMLGQEVATLVNEDEVVGNYKVSFNASGLASGNYVCRLVAGDYSETKKMTLLK